MPIQPGLQISSRLQCLNFTPVMHLNLGKLLGPQYLSQLFCLFTYLFLIQDLKALILQSAEAKPIWWVQSCGSLPGTRSPAWAVQLHGRDWLGEVPSFSMSPVPSSCMPKQEVWKGMWKSVASVSAAVWCHGHHLPLELEEAVKGLKLP